MKESTYDQITLYDFEPQSENFREEVLRGLQEPQKELSYKFFYDERGSQLFDQITELDEYYPTRTEVAIMRDNVDEMVRLLGPHCVLIEYGSGSSMKTRILLDHLEDLTAYIPIDISREHLLSTAMDLVEAYPDLEVLPVCADYTGHFELPPVEGPVLKRVAYFPGSTIANLFREEAVTLLKSMAALCGKGGGLLIGVDLKKDPQVLHAAYNDRDGVTAAFNLNLLARINRELDADFQLDQFRHYAFYNPRQDRIELHIVSLQNQTVHIDNTEILFKKGESIWTEVSHKYNLDDIEQMATRSGFEVEQVWIDGEDRFSVSYLRVR